MVIQNFPIDEAVPSGGKAQSVSFPIRGERSTNSTNTNCDDMETKFREIEERIGHYDHILSSMKDERRNTYDTRSILEHPPSPIRTKSSNSPTSVFATASYSGEMSESSKKFWDQHHSAPTFHRTVQVTESCPYDDNHGNHKDYESKVVKSFHNDGHFVIDTEISFDDDDEKLPLLSQRSNNKEQEEREEDDEIHVPIVPSPGKTKVRFQEGLPVPSILSQHIQEKELPKTNASNLLDTKNLYKSDRFSLKENVAEKVDSDANEVSSKEGVIVGEMDQQEQSPLMKREDEESLLPQEESTVIENLLEITSSQEDRIRMYTSGDADEESDPPSVVSSSHNESILECNDDEEKYDIVLDDQSIGSPNEDLAVKPLDGTENNLKATVENDNKTTTTTSMCSPCHNFFSIFFGKKEDDHPPVVTVDMSSSNNQKELTNEEEESDGEEEEEEEEEHILNNLSESNFIQIQENGKLVIMNNDEGKVESKEEGVTHNKETGDQVVREILGEGNVDNSIDASDTFSIDDIFPTSFDSAEEAVVVLEEEEEEARETTSTNLAVNSLPIVEEVSDDDTDESIETPLEQFNSWKDDASNKPSFEHLPQQPETDEWISFESNAVEPNNQLFPINPSPMKEEEICRNNTPSHEETDKKKKQTVFLPPPPAEKWESWLKEKNKKKTAQDLSHLIKPKSVEECKHDMEDYYMIESCPSDERGFYSINKKQEQGEAQQDQRSRREGNPNI